MGDARVGFALTGSFCTLEKAIRAMEETAREYPNMVPILSQTTGATDTRFGRAADFRQAAEEICGHGAVESVREAEPIGPKQLLDVLVIAPCTGNMERHGRKGRHLCCRSRYRRHFKRSSGRIKKTESPYTDCSCRAG